MANITQTNQQLPGTKPRFSNYLKDVNVRNLIANTLSDPARTARFVAAVSAAVANSPDDERYHRSLKDCDPATILTAALVGESLNLSPSPTIGHFYMVPFMDNKSGVMKAVFVLGYKGYLQLAMRSGVYRRINVLPLKSGELKAWNPLTEEAKVSLVENDAVRETMESTHYYAEFEYLNGFRKAICWTRAKMEAHALHYSKGYAAKKGYTFWEKDFDGMAMKTMLRQLIGKWGLMSTEMQSAFERDETAAESLAALPAPVFSETPATTTEEAASAASSDKPAELPAPEERPTIDAEAIQTEARAPVAAAPEHGGGNPPPRPAARHRGGDLF